MALAEFIINFMPTIGPWLQHTTAWQHVVPDSLHLSCGSPEPHLLQLPKFLTSSIPVLTSAGVQVSTKADMVYVSFRWPWLFPAMLLGFIVGDVGWTTLVKYQEKAQQFWAASFFWFMNMNLSAIICHSFLLPNTNNKYYVVLRALDVGFTGAACADAIRAVWYMRAQLQDKKMHVGWFSGPGFNTYALGILFVALSLSGNLQQVPLTEEILYPGILTYCVGVVGAYLWDMRNNITSTRAKAGFWTAWVALAFAVVAPALNPALCKLSGPHLNFVNVLFLACDCVYLGLLLYVMPEKA